MFIIINKKEKGFTLIELLVSIAIFAIVVVIVLGSIVSIVDSNRKSRSLMTVMNNLNFAVDSITRSFITGSGPTPSGQNNSCFTTNEINYREDNQDPSDPKIRSVTYCFDSGNKKITKQIGSETYDITSSDVKIEEATFELSNTGQPKLLININGKVDIGGRISSEFTIQTTATQRNLEIQ